MTPTDPYLLPTGHGPGPPDSAGRPRCPDCSYRHPCPTLRMTLPDQTEDETEVVELVTVGWTVCRRLPEPGHLEPAPSLIGGIVVDWEETDEGHRRFRCLDWSHGQPVYRHVNSTEIDPRDLRMPNKALLRNQARNLARLFAAKKGVLSTWDVELITAAHRLVTHIA